MATKENNTEPKGPKLPPVKPAKAIITKKRKK